jgi:hypothetical protein
MNKYGFVKGKGLGKNEQGWQEPIPFMKNNKISGVGASGLFLEEWYPFEQRLMVSNLRQAHIMQRRRRSTSNTQARPSYMLHKAHSM